MTTVQVQDDEDTARRSENVINILAGALDDLASQGSAQVPSGRIFTTVGSWWIFMTRSAQAIVALRRSGFAHEAAPIARTILQHGLVLQWLVDTGERGVDAVAQYGFDNLRKLLRTLEEASWPLPPDVVIETPPAPAPELAPLVQRLTNFAQLCIDYDARQLYVPFRLLSGIVHPSVDSAMAYVDANTGALLSRAVAPAHSHVIQAAMCLIQAGHAVSRLIAGDPLRAALNAAEAAFGAEVAPWSPHMRG